MSHSTTPTHGAAGSNKIFTVNWSLLGRRLRNRGGQLFTSARHRAATTEYIPPSWLGNLRLTWFRFGLIALVLFVLTQKQIDFTFSVGADGVAVTAKDKEVASSPQTSTLSMLPTGSSQAENSPARPAWTVDSYDELTVIAYVDRFARVAQTEEHKYGIPKAAKLAMAILESDAGQSNAARDRNNHFAATDGNRYYDNAWSSWRAHSEDLDRRFPGLAHESVNHQQWIAALAKTGYSRDAGYTQKLLQIIDRFALDRI